MLNISSPLSAAQAVAYHRAEFSNAASNYYTEGAEITGRWHGRFAASLGLVGPVDMVQFQRLADGRHPFSNDQLIRVVASHSYTNRHGETVTTMRHRAGWDATFSAPKSVSLAALVGGDERIRVAHRESVVIALDAIEHYTQARLGGARLPETTRQWAAATFEHDSARPVDGYSAPQLHTHAVVFNMTRTSLDRYRSIQPREWFKAQAFATAAYRAELARRLRELGYVIERGKSAQPEIKGFSKDYMEASSLRSQQIQKHLLEHGRAGMAAAQIAAYQTRDRKGALSRDEVQRQHLALAREHGDQPQKAVAWARQRGHVVLPDPTKPVMADVQYAKDRRMEREAVTLDRDVMADAMRRGMGHATMAAVRAEFDRRVEAGEFLDRAPARGSAANAYTTPEMVALEQATITRMQAGQGQYAPLVTPIVAAAVLHEHQHLNAGQRTAVQHILNNRDQVMALEGRAGTGKTFSVGVIREAAERQGFEVHGLAPTSRAAAQLAEAGMPTQTLQRFLSDATAGIYTNISMPGEQAVYIPRLIVLDEASLASTHLMRDFLDRLRPADRVLLVGDIRQHQSVDAGKSYEQLQQFGLHGARLKTIVRQPEPALREVVRQLSIGATAPALTQLHAMGKIEAIPDRTKRLQALADDFIRHPQGTLVVAPDNQSREAINVVIHAALQAQRTVGADHQPTRVLVARQDMTGTDRAYADRYDVGDVIRYTTGSAIIGLARGEYATVTQTDRAVNALTVQRQDGQQVTYQPDRLRGVTVHHEQERAFAVGDRIQFTAPSRDLAVANRQLGTIESLSVDNATVKLDAGREVRFRLADHPHLDFGYAVTSHSSQGLTADRVLVHIDSERSAETVVNQRLAYVALSRGRDDVRLYTDSFERLVLNLSRNVSHRAAIEAPATRVVTHTQAQI